MESTILSGLYKIEPLLSDEQIKEIRNIAYQCAKFFRVYFSIAKVDEQKKEIKIKVKQEKKPTDTPYYNRNELIDLVKKYFAPMFKEYCVIVHALPYTFPKSDQIEPETIKKEMSELQVRTKDIRDLTGLETSSISSWVSGNRPMSNIVKNMFYYFFQTIRLQKEVDFLKFENQELKKNMK